MPQRIRSILSVMMIFFCMPAMADRALLYKPEVRAFIHQLVTHDHFDQSQLRRALLEAEYQPQIIASMDHPYEKKNWDVYQALFLTNDRINNGLVFWRKNQAILAQAEKAYGVPAAMIVAIIGIETLYGKHQGQYRVLDALTTLAFYYPSRAPFFMKELREYFILCREHHVPISQYLGSYAGAMGQPQFMPSSYRAYARNFRGYGRTDLMKNDQDVIASVANYFHAHGWVSGEMIAQQVQVNTSVLSHVNRDLKTATYPVSSLFHWGVTPRLPQASYPALGGLIELTTQKGLDYWLVFPNFYVITRYNSSPQYALAAYLLALQLQQKWRLMHPLAK